MSEPDDPQRAEAERVTEGIWRIAKQATADPEYWARLNLRVKDGDRRTQILHAVAEHVCGDDWVWEVHCSADGTPAVHLLYRR